VDIEATESDQDPNINTNKITIINNKISKEHQASNTRDKVQQEISTLELLRFLMKMH